VQVRNAEQAEFFDQGKAIMARFEALKTGGAEDEATDSESGDDSESDDDSATADIVDEVSFLAEPQRGRYVRLYQPPQICWCCCYWLV